MDRKWYHVCWPRLTAKRVEPVVSISWASCLKNSHFRFVYWAPFLVLSPVRRKAKLPYTIFSPVRAVRYTTARHFGDKTLYIGKNYNLKLYAQTTKGPKMAPGSELVARPGFQLYGPWLQLWFDCHSTAIRTALRPLDDRAAALRPR